MLHIAYAALLGGQILALYALTYATEHIFRKFMR